MMVMPLGPDFARALGIPESDLGLIGGSYTASAAVTGLIASPFLDRFDRRLALGGAMLGLVLGTALGGFAQGFHSLVLARVVAGGFGGPATSLSLSIISDVIPPERRGRAIGTVMGAFSVASVLGVPTGLYLAEELGWRSPFFAVAGLGLTLVLAAIAVLPPLRGHLGAAGAELAGTRSLLSQPSVWLSYLMTALAMSASFMVLPNLSAYLQGNLGYPREGLKWLYFVGGFVSFAAIRVVGALVDRFGSFRVGAVGSLMLVVAMGLFFLEEPVRLPVMVLFLSMMVAMSFRNVPYAALATRVPRPFERARFQSLQSAVQHASSAVGAFVSAQMLSEEPGAAPVRRLVGMPRVALLSIALSLALPILMRAVEARVRRAEQASSSARTPPGAG
ncbi:MAG: MFS transporter [Myxococcales bacterium]|nr:MFS transporter [Myxococcales bacterium]